VSAPSLYRRHRPRTFTDVVGQEHVVRTLRNAVELGRVHHAYLFVGSRGTGKTSMAKILAASLNCVEGPTTSPCGVCESCRTIASATSLDVIEMDAASNNSVDDIRDLREKVAFAPVSGRSKVYILDEAHMLSTAAWNAFLKTLEEPPPHTIFVLATTEASKVLPTVVDRCHRFDFALPDEAAALVARSATGSFRDALGTLEQLLSYAGASIALDDVLAVLGAADADLLFGAVDAVAAGDPRGALHAAARLADSGRDVGRFFGDLEAHLRGLLVLHTLGLETVPPELAISAEQDARLLEQAGRVPASAVVRLLDLLAAGLRAMKDGADARTQLELALLRAASPEVDPGTRALLTRVERLEARLAGGEAPARVRDPAVAMTAAGRAAQAPAAADDLPPGRTHVALAVPVETSAPDVPAGGEEPGRPQRAADRRSAELATPADPEPAVRAVAVAEPDAPAAPPSVELDLGAFVALWPAVLEHVEGTLLAKMLHDARPFSLADGEVTVAVSGFAKRKAEAPGNQQVIVEAIRAVTGSSLRLAYVLRDDDAVAVGAPALSDDELVARFKAEFDAEELPPEPPESEETS
jgi:DNA polymerase-3 subunit gamma/tau